MLFIMVDVIYHFIFIFSVCDDDEFQRNDRHCWIGDRISDYDQIVMTPGQDTQRYNPEVPYEPTSKPTKLHELLDKLLKIRKNLDTAVSLICG